MNNDIRWQVNPGFIVVNSDGKTVANCNNKELDDAECNRNAGLIGNAPLHLAILRRIFEGMRKKTVKMPDELAAGVSMVFLMEAMRGES